MDPNATLQQIRSCAAQIVALRDRQESATHDFSQQISDLADELATACQALDSWIGRGGFLPAAWVAKPEAPPEGAREVTVDGVAGIVFHDRKRK